MKYIELNKKDNGVLEVWLNRPELHNAFNAELIAEIISVFAGIKDERLVILSGRGQSFCAGADLNWMRAMKDYSEEENFQDSKELARMFHVINKCPIPVIARVNGHALGGGVGLVSVCDYVVSVPESLFGFTEVRLGLIPAVISPYCIAKIGETHARAWMLSGERFSATKAQAMNLVHEVVEAKDLDTRVAELEKSFLMAGPIASREAKALVSTVVGELKNSEDYTCRMIASRRVSDEGQEGMRALLEKDKAYWMKK